MLGIQHPIMLAGMNWVTTPKLVSTVCNAGGLGILATAAFSPDETRKKIREIRKLTNKPFGINQVLNGPGAKENIAIAIEEKVPIINYSLGKPLFIDQVHAYGGKVIGTVAIVRHAARAAQSGCDILIVTGHEAAAHGHVATSLVLIPLVASMVKIPLIAAGGFHDGRGLAAALALGADGISMGTRFIVTRESAQKPGCGSHNEIRGFSVSVDEECSGGKADPEPFLREIHGPKLEHDEITGRRGRRGRKEPPGASSFGQ
jgi:enoyl-[acyl-carrier protein] reductase II